MGFDEITNILYLLLQGVGVGIAASITVGPVAVLCIQRTLSKSRRSGFASGFANAAISFSGPPVAIYALYVGWDKDTTRGTLSLYFLGISICTCIVQAAAGLYTPVVVKAALWGMPGALVGLVVSLPVARFVRESVFQGILLVMIAFAGSVCIIRAVESLL